MSSTIMALGSAETPAMEVSIEPGFVNDSPLTAEPAELTEEQLDALENGTRRDHTVGVVLWATNFRFLPETLPPLDRQPFEVRQLMRG